MESPLLVAGLAAVSFCTAMVTMMTTAGGGVLLLAIMGNLLPAPMVVPLHGAVMTSTNAGRAVMFWRYVDWSLIGGFLIGSMFGALAGANLVIDLPEALLNGLLAVGLLYLVWAPKWKNTVKVPGLMVYVGFFTTMISMVIGAAGVLMNAFLVRAGHEKKAVLANQAVSICALHAFKTLAFAWAGFAFHDHLPLLGTMMVAGWLGTYVAGRLVMKLSEETFRMVVKWVITVLAMRLGWLALVG